jgi:tetratricopeptide (TPR) repeat protein
MRDPPSAISPSAGASFRLLFSGAPRGDRHPRSRHAHQSARCPGSRYLGHLLYDRRRHIDAIRLWERSARLDPRAPPSGATWASAISTSARKPAMARAAYDRAFKANPSDARLLFERDQLWKRIGVNPAKRLRELESHLDLVRQRDDLSVELCALYNQTGQSAQALALVSPPFPALGRRRGRAPGAMDPFASVAGSRSALARNEAARARVITLTAALTAPPISAKPGICSPIKAISITGSAAPSMPSATKQHANIGARPPPSRAISRKCACDPSAK